MLPPFDPERERDPWTWESSRVAYDNPWISVEERRGANPQGQPALYGIVRMKRLAVGVLPIDADGGVHLVGQWRTPFASYSWEMPEGGAEAGESAEHTARRELEEESGLRAGRLERILELDLSNSTTDERAVLFLATALEPGVQAPDDTEVLAHARLHFQDVLAAVCSGAIRDAMTVAAVLRAHHMALTGALPAALAQAMTRRPAGMFAQGERS